MHFSVDWTYFLYTQHIYIYVYREIDNLQSSLEKNPQGMRLEPYVHHELFWRCLLSRAGEFYSDHRCSTAGSCHCT